jgi:hypothetical protein
MEDSSGQVHGEAATALLDDILQVAEAWLGDNEKASCIFLCRLVL